MEKGTMLKVLVEAMIRLPRLLDKEDNWKSLLIDYEPPVVERLYTDLEGGNRLSLHIIHPCREGEAFVHPHPWPSAMYIVSGMYKMDSGYGKNLEYPNIVNSVFLNAGSFYEMVNQDGWHSVRPLGTPSLSVMINGPSWNRPMPKVPQKELFPLRETRMMEVLDSFAEHRFQIIGAASLLKKFLE